MVEVDTPTLTILQTPFPASLANFTLQMKNYMLIRCLVLVATLFSLAVSAQTIKPKPGTVTLVAKFKPPVVNTFLGRNINGATVTVLEGQQLVGLPLRITDSAKNIYTVISYQFLYRKKSVVENEQTGKKEFSWTTLSDRFTVTPLPLVWRNNISPQVQKQEELYFFDILVADKLGRKFFAPEIKIKIN